jgi:hypothetical protein
MVRTEAQRTGTSKANFVAVDLYLMHFPIAYEFSDGYVTKRKPDGKVSDVP